MDINKPDAAAYEPAKTTFKCLTNITGQSNANTVLIKNRFNKLTLSSSNKKKHLSELERSNAAKCNPEIPSSDDTPTPKMLHYSSSDDENDPKLERQMSSVNRLLESSASVAASAESVQVPVPEVLQSCEASSFSQRLEMSDADETHCTLLHEQRRSERGDSVFHADTIVEPKTGNNLSLGTEMERLQITASSEDLFEEKSPNGQLANDSSSDNFPVAQSKAVDVVISDISQKLNNIELGTDKGARHSILTISSSQSSPEKAMQMSTRSSLASEEVYDVITLSDSDADDLKSNREEQPPVNLSSPHYNLSAVNSQSMEAPALVPVSSDLSSMAQNRLDRFFDNIPLLNSEEEQANKTSSTINSLNQSAAASSVYISETDEDEAPAEPGDNELAANKPEHGDVIETVAEDPEMDASVVSKETDKEQPAATDVLYDTVEISDDDDMATPTAVPQTVSSELIPTTQGTPVTAFSSSISGSSRRTPVINISAKFQIRIQVDTPQGTSSEYSSSNNTSRRSSFSEEPVKNDSLVNTQATRMSQMVINSDSNTNNTNGKTDSPAKTSAAAVTESPIKTKKPATTPRKVPLVRTQSESNQTPKSNTKKPQLSKLRTTPSRTPKPQQKDDECFLSPPKVINPTTSKIVLDDEDQRLLNELYGASWQTPDLLKKCVIRRAPNTGAKPVHSALDTKSGPSSDTDKTGKTKETVFKKTDRGTTDDTSRVSHDFSMFRKNIASANDLDSTRIDDVFVQPKSAKPKKIDRSVVASPFFKKTTATKKSNNDTVVDIKVKDNKKKTNRSKSKQPKAMAKPKRWQQILDSDTETDSELSDDTVDITDDISDEEPSNESVKKTTHKGATRSVRTCRTKTTRAYKITDDEDNDEDDQPVDDNGKEHEITYLDLTTAEVVEDEEHQAPNASDQDLEELSRHLLQGFEFHKPEFQHTPAPSGAPFVTPKPTTVVKTKRKLFTPYFDDVQQATDEIYQKHKITPPKNERLTIMDQLDDGSEARVKFRGGLPKFLQPTNKRLDDLRNEGTPVRPPLTPKNDDNVIKTPVSTPKSQRKVKEAVGTPKLPDTIDEIPKTPENKYGFLRSFDVELSKNLLHPTALQFREKFKTKKIELTALLYSMYNERLFGGRLDVPITWNKKLKTTAGYCYSRRRMGLRTAAIDLSDKVITSGDRLRCTLIHELCHAATWIFNADRGHGATWKTWAAKANAVFPDLPAIERCHSYEIDYKYTYQCTLCGAKSHAHSKSKKVELIRCAYCHGSIEIYLNKKDKDGAVCPTPVRKATGFAAFVKETYKDFKVAGVAHADVMRQLSAKYATLTVEEKKKY